MMARDLGAEFHTVGAVQQAYRIGPVYRRLILLAVVPVEPAQIRQPALGECNTRDAVCIRAVWQAELSGIPLIAVRQNISVAIHADTRFVHQLRSEDVGVA